MSYEDCIDVVKEWVLSLAYATKAWVQARGYLTTGYIHNPCVLGWDLAVGDYDKDGNWHNLDLSGIVPSNAKAILLHLRIKSNAAQTYILFRKPGEGDYGCCTYTYTQVADIRLGAAIVVTPDTNGIIEYRVQFIPWAEINTKIMGWWL